MTPFGAVLKAAVLAGLIAGAVVAGFHSLLTEPVIDRAIVIEKQLSRSQGARAEEPVVSRRAQRVALVFGFLLYGVIWGLLFGVLFYLTAAWQPSAWTEARCGFLLAAVAAWSVGVFPFLKYPANPPGVGDQATIGYRQMLHLVFIGLSILGAVLAFGLQRSLSRARQWGRPIALILYLVYLVVIYWAMPANPDPVRMLSQVVWTFRALSLAGLVLFWAMLGGAFAWLARDHLVNRSWQVRGRG